jgi:hypothetical protein
MKRTEVATESLHGSASLPAGAAVANPSGILKAKQPKKSRGVRGVTHMATDDCFLFAATDESFLFARCPRCDVPHLVSARCASKSCQRDGMQQRPSNPSADAVEAEWRAIRHANMLAKSAAFWASNAGASRAKQIAERGSAARFWVDY